MQTRHLKLFLIFLISFVQIPDIKAQNEIAKKADSLFSANNYTESTKLYESLMNDKLVNRENLFLKLAYINENQNNYPKALYYLNCYFNEKPSDRVFDKMNTIAQENKYSGFERSDRNFVLMLYNQYFIYILLAFLAIGMFMLYLLLKKQQHGLKITNQNKIVAFIYIVYLIFLVNTPRTLNSGVINTSANLRLHPTSASPIIGQITAGNKVNIFGKTDIWYKTLYNNEIVYLNKRDIWVLPN